MVVGGGGEVFSEFVFFSFLLHDIPGQLRIAALEMREFYIDRYEFD